MASLGTAFNANEVEPGEKRDFSAMPNGNYLVNIIASEVRQVKLKFGEDPNSDPGSYLWFEVEVMEGEFERRKLWPTYNLNNKNQQTVEIARQQFRELCLACNKPTIEDTEELHGIPFMVELVVERDRRNKNLAPGQPEYPPVNRIKSYMPAGNGAGAGYVASAPRQQMPMSAPGGFTQAAATPAAPVAQAAPRPAAGGLPWGKR